MIFDMIFNMIIAIIVWIIAGLAVWRLEESLWDDLPKRIVQGFIIIIVLLATAGNFA